MARIIDKDTRLIDVDFGQITLSTARTGGDEVPNNVTTGGVGVGQLLNVLPAGQFNGGSFIQYVRLDLDYMTRNNEVMMPTEASIQRTSPVPLGFNLNGNNYDQMEEFIFILTRPLNNVYLADNLPTPPDYNGFRAMGLNGTTGSSAISGNAGWPNQEQTIYAEKRMYSYSSQLGATKTNGELDPLNPDYNSLMGMPVLDSVTTWGSMEAIVGPNLHCYRIVINRNQSFPSIGLAGTIVNTQLDGSSACEWPAVSVRFLCKDPNFTEGEYLTRVANAMNSIAEGGPVSQE